MQATNRGCLSLPLNFNLERIDKFNFFRVNRKNTTRMMSYRDNLLAKSHGNFIYFGIWDDY